MVRAIRVDYEGGPDNIVERAIELFTERSAERSRVPVTRAGTADLILRLGLDATIGAEGFRIAQAAGNVIELTGNDPRGLLYGVGKFARGCRFGDGAIEPSSWRGVSVPARPVRGIYFATHFGNYYEAAPVEEIERYVEDLALWGCNTLSVWFDMHQYAGITDPKAQQMITRLRRILDAANRVGIRAALTTLANEGYANSPEALRADWTAGHDGYTSPPGGHYHREICPSKPGGLDYILDTRREVLAAFQDLDIAYVWIWPYDQGGCTCAQCAPWGANGFLRTAEPVARLIRDQLPNTKIVLSTWYFDHFTTGEWEGLARAFSDGAPEWVDLLLAGDFGGFPQHLRDHGVPGDLPVVSFPEISMEGNSPWGGYGMNPRPANWEAYERRNGSLLSGSFPYSEGIYEDINKVLLLQLNWAPERPANDIVEEYASYEFSPDVAHNIVSVVGTMEAGLGHGLSPDVREQVTTSEVHTPDDLCGKVLYRIAEQPHAQDTIDLLDAVALRLPNWARTAWRWRLLWLRAALDSELHRSGGQSTHLTEAYIGELAGLYHTTEALLAVTPPTRSALFRIFREQHDREP